MSQDKVYNVAIVGLSFGAEFIPIYQRHLNAEMAAICQRTESELNKVGDAFGIPQSNRFTDYKELLKRDDIDIVHINTPPFLHADQVVAALEAGKHTASTIPMALSVEDCKRIVAALGEAEMFLAFFAAVDALGGEALDFLGEAVGVVGNLNTLRLLALVNDVAVILD